MEGSNVFQTRHGVVIRGRVGTFTVNLSESASPPSQERIMHPLTLGPPSDRVRIRRSERYPDGSPKHVVPPMDVVMVPREQARESQMYTGAGKGSVLRDDPQPALPRGSHRDGRREKVNPGELGEDHREGSVSRAEGQRRRPSCPRSSNSCSGYWPDWRQGYCRGGKGSKNFSVERGANFGSFYIKLPYMSGQGNPYPF